MSLSHRNYSNLVPGRQALNIRWEEVFARDRNPHAENRLHQQRIRACGARAVNVGQLQREVVDQAFRFVWHGVKFASSLA